jgi:phosphonoacetaldehyde hydrolase
MYVWTRRYAGSVRAVMLGWSGTVVDHGCQATVEVLVDVFKRHGVTLTPSQVRAAMGSELREHIRYLCMMPAVRRAWILRNGAPPNEDDIAAMYGLTTEELEANLPHYATLIPGVGTLATRLDERGVRIGTTTAFTRDMLRSVEMEAAANGFRAHATVTATDVEGGRPAPWMLWRAAERLQVHPPEACVVVGDTPAEIEAGLNAGMWTVGIACTGNLIGLSAQDWAATPPDRRAIMRDAATRKLEKAGAHFVIDAAAYLLPVIDEIDARLRDGNRP